MAPRDVHTLIPQTCEYGNLQGKKGFTDVIKFRILRWAGLSDEPSVITRVIRRRRRDS